MYHVYVIRNFIILFWHSIIIITLCPPPLQCYVCRDISLLLSKSPQTAGQRYAHAVFCQFQPKEFTDINLHGNNLVLRHKWPKLMLQKNGDMSWMNKQMRYSKEKTRDKEEYMRLFSSKEIVILWTLSSLVWFEKGQRW